MTGLQEKSGFFQGFQLKSVSVKDHGGVLFTENLWEFYTKQ